MVFYSSNSFYSVLAYVICTNVNTMQKSHADNPFSSPSSLLLLQLYSPWGLVLVSFTTNSHSVLSQALVLHLFTPIFHSIPIGHHPSTLIYIFLCLPFLLVCLPLTPVLSCHRPFLQQSQATPISVLQLQLH